VLPELDAFAGRSIFQIAFVVGDIEDALARYSAVLGAGPWRCWTFGAKDNERCEYRGGPTDFASRLALNDQTPQLELIEPLTGPSAHRDWFEERGEGLHHLGVIVPSVADVVEEASAAGYEVVQSGAGIGPARDGAWAYIDTSAALGCMIEAVEPPTSMPPVEFTWPAAS
jgi:methylmalonyl-CoA/ethylmalonyl-CoA epimerase